MIGVIVGNGLLIDLLHHVPGAMSSWNPRTPLSWNLPSFEDPDRLFLDDLPQFRDAISRVRINDQTLPDFDAIRAILPDIPFERHFDGILAGDPEARSHMDDEENYTGSQARHFLVMSFSMLQKYLDNRGLGDWDWLVWFRLFHRKIGFVVSLNYDLLLEKIFESVGDSYFRYSLENSERGRLPILKPHGSIDFTSTLFSIGQIRYPLNLLYYLNNEEYLTKWPRDRLDEPRLQADLVLPTEYSRLQGFQWMRRGMDMWDRVAPHISSMVFIGLSYWDSDREEVDRFTDELPRGTRIIMANPNPSDEWCQRLEQRFGHVEKWKSGPVLREGFL